MAISEEGEDMTAVDELETLLSTASAYREDATTKRLREDARVESPDTIAGWAFDEKPYAPFAKRGLLIGFDAEGGYHRQGAHAKLAKYLLGRVGVDATAEDAFVEGTGLFIRLGATGKIVLVLDPKAHDSDYCHANVVLIAVDDLLRGLKAKSRLLWLRSDDQGVLIAVVPARDEKAFRTALEDCIEDHDEVRRRVTWPSQTTA